MLDRNKIKKILVVSLSNIGDIILTFPVIDILKRDFPDAVLDLIVGPKGASLVTGNPNFRKVYIFHKHQSGIALLKWMGDMGKEHYDLAVDLRASAIPFLVFAKHLTPLMIKRPQGVHMRTQHLLRLKTVHKYSQENANRISLYFSPEDSRSGDQILEKHGLKVGGNIAKFILIAPGARAENKRWQENGFAQLADHLAQRYQSKIVFVGDENDAKVVKRISSVMKSPASDLSGQLTLTQLGAVMKHASLALVNDSAPMHMASYLNIPVVALFGPTDPKKYGPWSKTHFVVKKNGHCPACTGTKDAAHVCLNAVTSDDVLSVVEMALPEILNAK